MPEKRPPPNALAYLPAGLGVAEVAAVLSATTLRPKHKLLWLWMVKRAAEGGSTLPAKIQDNATALAAELGEKGRNVSNWLNELIDHGLVERLDRKHAGDSELLILDPCNVLAGWAIRKPSPQIELFDTAPEPMPEPSHEAAPVLPLRQFSAKNLPQCKKLPQYSSAPPEPPSSISARAPLLFLVDAFNNNQETITQKLRQRSDDVRALARETYRTILGKRHRPRVSDNDRLLLIRCAYLALEHWGESWLRETAQARPGSEPANRPMAFFRAVAAYTAWEHLCGERADTPDERDQARKTFRTLLSAIPVPPELTERKSDAGTPA
ncbi:MAG: hypothetical protein RBS80_22990 [Thermoguttaceae bacterium]|jgi:hypothetical protein|nr:hypothetical protein [Thermoguttaceae bacterium]